MTTQVESPALTYHRARVTAVRPLTPHMVRVTFAAESFREVPAGAPDQYVKVFFPLPGQEAPVLPETGSDVMSWYRTYLAMPDDVRPPMRTYTARAIRPEEREVDVDFVLHGSVADGTSGPAATWAQQCRPGDPVALLDEGIMFTPPDPGAPVVLVADETAVPAASAILESLPLSARGTAYLEVPDPDDVAHVSSPEGVEIVWLPRDDAGAVPGRAALAAAVAAPTDPASFAWVAGEQGLVAALRREWIARGVPKDAIRFCGYWRQSRH